MPITVLHTYGRTPLLFQAGPPSLLASLGWPFDRFFDLQNKLSFHSFIPVNYLVHTSSNLEGQVPGDLAGFCVRLSQTESCCSMTVLSIFPVLPRTILVSTCCYGLIINRTLFIFNSISVGMINYIICSSNLFLRYDSN